MIGEVASLGSGYRCQEFGNWYGLSERAQFVNSFGVLLPNLLFGYAILGSGSGKGSLPGIRY